MRAYLTGRTAEDLRHNVAALVAGKHQPTMGEFAEASYKADVAVKIAPNEPWGYSARCLVALKIGERDVLDSCLTDLKRVAPDHPETKRMLAMARSGDSVFATFGRCLLALAFLGTLAHALKTARKPRRPASPQLVLPLLICVLALAAISGGTALAETPAPPVAKSKQPNLSGIDISDANPETNIPSPDEQLKDPLKFGYLLQDFLANAKAAEKRGDKETAARYYLALAKAVPTAYGPSHLCQERVALNDREGALSACREAAAREGVTLADYARLAGLLMHHSDPLSDQDRTELQTILNHVTAQKEAGLEGERLRCNIATRLHDIPTLDSCTGALANAAAGDGVTISFQWSLAMEKHDFAAAEKAVVHARQAGVAKEVVATMERATPGLHRRWLIRTSSWIVGGALAIVLLAVGARRFGLPRRRVAV
jgi:hypothetical protein